MTVTSLIEKAGKYPVTRSIVPYVSHKKVDLTLPRTGVLHTTEGGFVGGLAELKRHYAPHFMLGLSSPGHVEIVQLTPVGVEALSTRANDTMVIVQIEMVGFSKETPWLPDPLTLDALAELMLVCRDEWGIPLSHPWPDGDYGRAGHNPHRSAGKLGKIAGWYGHGDMPDPDVHWDPGNLRWSQVFSRALALDTARKKTTT